MTVKDMMLDLATGDASAHDAYVQEAVGKIRVSSEYFNVGYKIANVPDGDFSVVQEAADAGLPTDKEGGSKLACEAVQQQLKAFFDLLIETSKKTKQAAEKDMKLLLHIGKKMGVTYDNTANFITSFAEPFAKAVVSGKSLSLDQATFLKGRYSNKIGSKFGKGMCEFLSAYGLNLDEIFEDPAIASYFGKKGAKNVAATTLNGVDSALSDGASLMAFEKITAKDSHYTNTIKEADVRELATAIYVVFAISKGVASLSSSKKAALANIVEICNTDSSGSKKITRAIESIGSDMNDWTAKVTGLTESVVKAFTDSVYSLTDKLNKA